MLSAPSILAISIAIIAFAIIHKKPEYSSQTVHYQRLTLVKKARELW